VITSADLSTLVLDALNCFIFTLNADGIIECASDHVTKFLKYSPVCSLSPKMIAHLNI